MCDDFTLQKYTRFPNPPNDTIEAAIDPPHSTTQTESSVGNCSSPNLAIFYPFFGEEMARCGEMWRGNTLFLRLYARQRYYGF